MTVLRFTILGFQRSCLKAKEVCGNRNQQCSTKPHKLAGCPVRGHNVFLKRLEARATPSGFGQKARRRIRDVLANVADYSVETEASVQQPASENTLAKECTRSASHLLGKDTINGLTVLVIFGWLLCQFCLVDQDHWRAWTLTEIFREMPHHNWLRYEDGLRTNPVLTKACISGFVYGFGDWIAQVYKNGGLLNFDRKRILSAVTIGFIGHGPLSHYYYLFADELFQPLHLTGAAEPLVKVVFDQTIWSGVWNSIYFTMMGCLQGDSISTTIVKVRSSFFPMIMTGWKLWPFAHCVTYGLIPQQHRVLFVDTVEIVWVVLLSLFESRDHGQAQQGVLQQAGNDLSRSLPSTAVPTGDQAQSEEYTRGCPRNG